MVLERELRYFDEHLDEWLTIYRGQFVVVKGEELLGSFSTADEALKAGAERFGTETFLIRQVEPPRPATYNPTLVVGALFARP